MSIRFSLNSELGLAVITLEGVVSREEIERRIVPLMEIPEYNMLPLTLVDASEARLADLVGDIVLNLAQRAAKNVDEKIADGARLAIVACADECFGVGRMYELLRGGTPVEIRVFRSLTAAEEWLGLSQDHRAGLELRM